MVARTLAGCLPSNLAIAPINHEHTEIPTRSAKTYEFYLHALFRFEMDQLTHELTRICSADRHSESLVTLLNLNNKDAVSESANETQLSGATAAAAPVPLSITDPV